MSLKPFLPSERQPASSQRIASVAKAVHAMATIGERSAAAASLRDDAFAAEIVKTATLPASTTTASTFAAKAVADLLDMLGPASAFRPIMGSGVMMLGYARYASVLAPTYSRSATNVKFVGEGAPHPVGKLSIKGPTLTKQKLMLSCALTRELATGSNGLVYINTALQENLDAGLDEILLDATEGDTTRPSGLRFGVNALTASDNADPHSAMVADLAALGGAVCDVGGANLVFVAAVPQWLAIQLWCPQLRVPVFPSGGLSAGQVLCLAPRALAVVGGNEPIKLDVSDQATVHLEDTSPQPLTTAATATYPTMSTFQQDTLLVRLRCAMSWALRVDSGAVAWTQNVGW